MDKSFYKRLITIALPISIQQLIISSLNFVDTFMISSLTKEAIAGVGAANKIFFMLNLFMFGLSSGSSILTAQFWGVKDVKSIQKVYGLSLTIAVIGASLFTFAVIGFPEVVLGVFSTDPQVIAEGVAYIRIAGISYVFTAITFATVFVLRSTNFVRLPMVVTIIAILLNTFLNWTFIFGNLGFEAMGVRGAALGTTIARVVEMTLILASVHILKLPPAAKFKALFGFNKPLTKKFFKIATPVVINEVLWSVGVTMYSVVFGRMSTYALAAITITQTIEQIAWVLIIGVGNACGIILGNDLGAGKDTVFRDAKSFVRIHFFIGVILGLFLIVFSKPLASIFDVEDLVYYNIVGTLCVFGLYANFRSVNMAIIVGILRSGGDTIYTAILDGLGVWVIGVPLAFYTGLVLKWDLPYVYAAVLIEEVVKLAFGVQRLLSKKWMNNLVDTVET